jgi:glucan 1,3-beta-glucosidase
LEILTAEFTQSTYNHTVLTIELINEPYPWTSDETSTLQAFYESAYDAVRGVMLQSSLVVAIDEAFMGLQAWEGFMSEPTYSDVAMDTVSELYVVADLSMSTRCRS